MPTSPAGRAVRLALLLLLMPSITVPPAIASGPILTVEYPLPPGITAPTAIAAGPDGNLWFVGGAAIGRITPQGSATPIARLTGAVDIVLDADGKAWVTICTTGSAASHALARITPDGVTIQFTTRITRSCPQHITAGPDGRLWYTDTSADTIGAISTSGDLTEYPLPPAAYAPQDITTGPDGKLWFTAQDRIGSINTGGTIMTYPLPAGSAPESIATGADGNLWFVKANGDAIGRSDTNGSATEFFLPQAGNRAREIARGPDGNLWFTEDAGLIGRITAGGQITEFTPPSANGMPFGVATGADGNLWFAETTANQIAKMLVTQTKNTFLPVIRR